MTASLVIQYVVIVLAVLLSAWVVLKQQFPQAARRTRIVIAAPLLRDGRPAWIRSVARRIAPAAANRSGGACGGCDNCGPPGAS